MCSRNCILRDALVWSNVTYTTGECIRHHIVIYWTIYNFLLISLHRLGYVSAVMCDKLCWQAVNYITYPEQIRFYRLYSMARISQLVKIIWTTKVRRKKCYLEKGCIVNFAIRIKLWNAIFIQSVYVVLLPNSKFLAI